MERQALKIYDTSLRDGLRKSGISMSLDQKLCFARQLEQLNIDAIEVGYGGPSQLETMQKIAEAVSRPVVYGLSRVNLKDVARVVEGVGRAKKPGVNIFSPTSEDFLTRAKKTWQRALDETVAAVRYARQHVDHVVFSAQDASRSEPAVLTQIISAAIDAGATVVSLADTMSYAVPSEFGSLCEVLRSQVANSDSVTWSVHCHNEIGLAVANSLAAIENGIVQVECTLDGIGEGAGNTALQAVVNAVRSRADVFSSVTSAVAVEQFPLASQLLREIRQAG